MHSHRQEKDTADILSVKERNKLEELILYTPNNKKLLAAIEEQLFFINNVVVKSLSKASVGILRHQLIPLSTFLELQCCLYNYADRLNVKFEADIKTDFQLILESYHSIKNNVNDILKAIESEEQDYLVKITSPRPLSILNLLSNTEIVYDDVSGFFDLMEVNNKMIIADTIKIITKLMDNELLLPIIDKQEKVFHGKKEIVQFYSYGTRTLHGFSKVLDVEGFVTCFKTWENENKRSLDNIKASIELLNCTYNFFFTHLDTLESTSLCVMAKKIKDFMPIESGDDKNELKYIMQTLKFRDMIDEEKNNKLTSLKNELDKKRSHLRKRSNSHPHFIVHGMNKQTNLVKTEMKPELISPKVEWKMGNPKKGHHRMRSRSIRGSFFDLRKEFLSMSAPTKKVEDMDGYTKK